MSMYNIYVEAQGRDAYVARKAVEKYAAERDEKERLDRREKALKSKDHTAYHNAWMKVSKHNSHEADKVSRQGDLYNLDADQYGDYENAARRSGDKESERKYRDLRHKAENNAMDNWLASNSIRSRDKKDAIDAVLQKEKKEEKKYKHESGIFAECVLI